MRFVEGVGYVDDTSYIVNQKTTTNSVKNADFQVALDAETNKLNQEKTEMSLDAIFEEAAKKYHLPKDLLTAVAYHESGFQPNVTSSSGAMGIMQLMPSTCQAYGVTDPYDPYQNIMGGAAVLNVLSRMYNGDLILTLAGYNAGCGNVAKYGGVPPFKETQNYIAKISQYIKDGVTVPNTISPRNTDNSIKAPVTDNKNPYLANPAQTEAVSDSAKAQDAARKAEIIAEIQQIMRDILAMAKSREKDNNTPTIQSVLNSTNNLIEEGLNALTGTTQTQTKASDILSDILSNMQELQVTPESLDQLMTYTQYQFMTSHYTNMVDIISTLGTATISLGDDKENDSLTDLFQLGNYQITFNKASLNLRQPT